MSKLVVFAFCCLVSALAGPIDDTRIVGGSAASPGQFPHQISLRKSNSHTCGGSILNATTILTAAHCVDGQNVNGYTVVVGTNALNSGGIAHTVTGFIIHSSYNPNTFVNDIAIVKIATSIQYTNLVQPVRLASSNPQNNAQLTMSGWGLTSYPGNIPNSLQTYNTRNLDLNTCAQRLAGVSAPITTGHVCANSPSGQGICMGDSGGPLIDSYTREQVGIASWVIPCGRGQPDVYTSVAFYRNWISLHAN